MFHTQQNVIFNTRKIGRYPQKRYCSRPATTILERRIVSYPIRYDQSNAVQATGLPTFSWKVPVAPGCQMMNRVTSYQYTQSVTLSLLLGSP